MLEDLLSAVKQEKEIKGIQIKKTKPKLVLISRSKPSKTDPKGSFLKKFL